MTDLSTRAISSDRIAAAIGRPTYAGFVELRSEDPPPATALEPVELPELNNGPHFFYGLQWWFFAALAVFGFFYLAWEERRKARRRPPASPGRVTRGGYDTGETVRSPQTGSRTENCVR